MTLNVLGIQSLHYSKINYNRNTGDWKYNKDEVPVLRKLII